MHPVIDRRGRRRHHGGMLIIDLSHIRPGARVILTPRRLRAAERRALANRAAMKKRPEAEAPGRELGLTHPRGDNWQSVGRFEA